MKFIKKIIASTISVCLISTTTYAMGGVVESPTLLAQLIKQYEQYVEMLQKAQDQVERLNKVNESLSKANNLARNSQLNFYNPMDILENLKDTIEGIRSNVNAMSRTVKDFDIRDRITFKRIQAKCPEISQKLLEAKYQVKDDDGSNRENEGAENAQAYTAAGEETQKDALLKKYLETFTNVTQDDIDSVTGSIRGLPQAVLLCHAFAEAKKKAQLDELENKIQSSVLANDFNAYKQAQEEKMKIEAAYVRQQQEEFENKLKPLYIRTKQMQAQLGVIDLNYNKEAEKRGKGKNFFCEEGMNNGKKGCSPKLLNLDYVKFKELEMLEKAQSQTNEEKSQTQADREFLMIAYLREIATHLSFLNETTAMTASLMAEKEAKERNVTFGNIDMLEESQIVKEEHIENIKANPNYFGTETITPNLNEFGFPTFSGGKSQGGGNSGGGGGRTEL